MRARSVQTALPEMSLPSHTDSGLACPGMSPKMSPSVTSFGRQVRHLDADRLLAGDRREDADLGRRERVRKVVLQPGHLGHLRPGRELQLVADDPRPGDLSDDRRVDAEMRERLHELLCGARARLAVVALNGGDAFSSERSGKPVLAGGCRLELDARRSRPPSRHPSSSAPRQHERRWLGRRRRGADDVGVLGGAVDERRAGRSRWTGRSSSRVGSASPGSSSCRASAGRRSRPGASHARSRAGSRRRRRR